MRPCGTWEPSLPCIRCNCGTWEELDKPKGPSGLAFKAAVVHGPFGVYFLTNLEPNGWESLADPVLARRGGPGIRASCPGRRQEPILTSAFLSAGNCGISARY